MLQLIKCVFVIFIFLLIFTVWGHSVSRWLSIDAPHLPMQMLVGFFALFIVMEVVILPVVFLHNSLKLATVLTLSVVILLTIIMLFQHRAGFLSNVKQIEISIWTIIAVVVLCLVTGVAVLQQYLGYDPTYYIGEMAAFINYGEFWTRDAIKGMEVTSEIPLHYALSCFYPLFAIFAYVFHINARIMALYVVRGLCVLLFGATTFCWGYELFDHQKKNGYFFTIICCILTMFLLDDHSLAFMMMVRGYESKGYCAAVVAPMCVLALIRLCRDVKSKSDWRLLGLVAWASMPVAMSSMAIIPVAIAVVGLSLMICHRQFKYIFIRCFICVVPNMILMFWYVAGAKLPALWR